MNYLASSFSFTSTSWVKVAEDSSRAGLLPSHGSSVITEQDGIWVSTISSKLSLDSLALDIGLSDLLLEDFLRQIHVHRKYKILSGPTAINMHINIKDMKYLLASFSFSST